MPTRIQEPEASAPFCGQPVNFLPQVLRKPLELDVLLHVAWLHGFGDNWDSLLHGPGEAYLGMMGFVSPAGRMSCQIFAHLCWCHSGFVCDAVDLY